MGNENVFPEECLLRSIKKQGQLTIGIPKENQENETRLPLTPEAVNILVEEGHTVLVEKGAGLGMNYTDLRYSDNGAVIVEQPEKVFDSNIVLKVTPPKPEEVEMMKEKSTLFSMLQLSLFSQKSIVTMMQKKITSIAYELIKDEQRNFPVVSSLCEIEGTTAIQVVAENLTNEHGGKGLLFGGIAGLHPTEVLILGAGIAGSVAARVAMSLGAEVKVFDHDINKLRKIQQALGQQVYTSVIHPKVLFKALASADAVIASLRYINGSERFMVSEDLVKTMKTGAVIVDLSVDQGGCFETSECRTLRDPSYVKHGVIHYCAPNISSRVGRTASMALSNIFVPILLKIGNSGCVKDAISESAGFRNGVYLYNGVMVNRLIGNHFNIPSNEIGLLLAGF